MTQKKLLIALVVVLAAGGFAAKTFLMPKPAVAKPKIVGTIYVLPKGFTFNLTDGRYATMTLGLVLAPGRARVPPRQPPERPPPPGWARFPRKR